MVWLRSVEKEEIIWGERWQKEQNIQKAENAGKQNKRIDKLE